MQDATEMTVASMQRIWGWPPIDLQEGQQIDLNRVPRGQSLLQAMVDKEEKKHEKGLKGRKFGRVVGVTFLGWQRASKK